jgi:hypothetical protein
MVKSSKNNKLDIVASTNCGHNVIHNTATGKSEVKVPQPEKVEVAPIGVAKASPAFQKVEPKALGSKEEEAKVLANNVVKTEEAK